MFCLFLFVSLSPVHPPSCRLFFVFVIFVMRAEIVLSFRAPPPTCLLICLTPFGLAPLLSLLVSRARREQKRAVAGGAGAEGRADHAARQEYDGESGIEYQQGATNRSKIKSIR